jgi:hypothetical protein
MDDLAGHYTKIEGHPYNIARLVYLGRLGYTVCNGNRFATQWARWRRGKISRLYFELKFHPPQLPFPAKFLYL